MRTIVCQCANARVLSDDALEKVCKSGEPVEIVADLCEHVARGRFTPNGPLKVYACHPRAVKSLLPNVVEVVDLRIQTVTDDFVGRDASRRFEVSRRAGDTPDDAARYRNDRHRALQHEGAQEPATTVTTPGAWFPVIDFDRCNHCMQCLSFCLFGVFTAKDGKIRVAQPDNCKPNCPACARVCPEAAIIFPKHPEPVIHGGDGQRAKVDVSALLGGDVYQTLRKRSRFDKDRDAATALAERRQHLARLQKELGIPPEVLRDL
jgi:NAD-dependent dihydropyrimidine dehydrogenase PreA subunit